MSFDEERPQLFDGDREGRPSLPSVKSWLLILNLQIEWIISNIDLYTRFYPQIIYAEGFTLIEKYTLALEDRYYFSHRGIDWRAVPRMLRQVACFRRVGGVSTIEQQLVRTILERRERTLRRKSRELILAWILSHRLSKRDILRAYLAMAYFGHGVRGCDDASILLFGVPSTDLESRQAAFIASLLVYPLPSIVKSAGIKRNLYPIIDINAFLHEMYAVAPRWVARVRRRMNYGLFIVRNSK